MKKLHGLLPFAYAICLFFLVFGAKSWILEHYSSDLPNWDQWDAEATNLLLPYFRHELSFVDLFKPHNEHRIFLTKALNLGLVLLGGQWDARAECVANAILHSALAAGVYLAGRRLLKSRWHIPLFVMCAIVFGLPISWQNILGGLHSAQSFLLWFSLATIWLLCTSRTYSLGWWAGLFTAVLANFSLGSGFFAAASVAAVLILRTLLRHISWRESLPTLGACSIAVAVGLVMRVPYPGHDFLKARSFREFELTFLHCIRWPNIGSPEHRPRDFRPRIVYIIYIPLILLAWQSLCQKSKALIDQNVILVAGAWLFLQCAATAYARGADASWPASRYLDTLAFGLLVNGVALAFLFDHAKPFAGRCLFIVLCLFSLTWIAVVTHGLWQQTRIVITKDLPEEGVRLRDCEQSVRAYLRTGDIAHLSNHVIPYPSAAELSERLSHPEIRAVMPTGVRAPLQQNDSAASPAVFTPILGGYLKIQPVHDVVDSALTLSTIDAKTGKTLYKIEATREPGARWRPIYLPVPSRPVQLVASGRNSADRPAFIEPVEMSTFSFLTMQLVKQAELIFFSALAVLSLLGGIHLIYFRRSNKSPRD